MKNSSRSPLAPTKENRRTTLLGSKMAHRRPRIVTKPSDEGPHAQNRSGKNNDDDKENNISLASTEFQQRKSSDVMMDRSVPKNHCECCQQAIRTTRTQYITTPSSTRSGYRCIYCGSTFCKRCLYQDDSATGSFCAAKSCGQFYCESCSLVCDDGDPGNDNDEDKDCNLADYCSLQCAKIDRLRRYGSCFRCIAPTTNLLPTIGCDDIVRVFARNCLLLTRKALSTNPGDGHSSTFAHTGQERNATMTPRSKELTPSRHSTSNADPDPSLLLGKGTLETANGMTDKDGDSSFIYVQIEDNLPFTTMSEDQDWWASESSEVRSIESLECRQSSKTFLEEDESSEVILPSDGISVEYPEESLDDVPLDKHTISTTDSPLQLLNQNPTTAVVLSWKTARGYRTIAQQLASSRPPSNIIVVIRQGKAVIVAPKLAILLFLLTRTKWRDVTHRIA